MALDLVFFTLGLDKEVAASGFSLDFTGGTLPAGTTFTRASSGTRFNAAGVLVSETTDVARFDYSPSSVGTLLGLLVEPAATNLFKYSEALGSWDGPSNVTIGANAVAAPDGATTADKLAETAASGDHRILHSDTAAPNGPVTASVFLKAAERTFALVQISDFATAGTETPINLSNGAKGTSTAAGAWSAPSAVTQEIGGGYYRASHTATKGAGTQAVPIIFTATDILGTTNYAGAAGSGLYVWGMQVETGSVATSYIPTNGSTTTRAADSLSFTVPAGVSTLRYTFDDLSTQDVVVAPGAYTVPTTLNRARIRGIVGS